MSFITRGFAGRGRRTDTRIPPGQHEVSDWPVLTAGPTIEVPTDEWTLTIHTEDGAVRRWNWAEFQQLPMEEPQLDISCVTHWTRLDMPWRGVPLDVLFDGVRTEHAHVMAHSYGDYTTNVPLAELLGGRSWVMTEAFGEPLTAQHGGPARLVVPHLYFWKSAKWLKKLVTMPEEEAGFWESRGYHLHGDPQHEERYG